MDGLSTDIEEGFLRVEGKMSGEVKVKKFVTVSVPVKEDFRAKVQEDHQTGRIQKVDPSFNRDSLLITALKGTGNFGVDTYLDDPQEKVLHLLNMFFDGQATIDDCSFDLHPDKGIVRLKGSANGQNSQTG
jgi:hypothetical protein